MQFKNIARFRQVKWIIHIVKGGKAPLILDKEIYFSRLVNLCISKNTLNSYQLSSDRVDNTVVLPWNLDVHSVSSALNFYRSTHIAGLRYIVFNFVWFRFLNPNSQNNGQNVSMRSLTRRRTVLIFISV